MTVVASLIYLSIGYFAIKKIRPIHINNLIVLAIIIHSVDILPSIFKHNGLLLDIHNALSISGFFIAIILLITQFVLKSNIDFFTYPIIALFIFVSNLFNQNNSIIVSYDLGFHVLLSIIAYAILSICFLQSLLLNYKHNCLHHKKNNYFTECLPNLEIMKDHLYNYLKLGTLLLFLALFSGFIFLENLFAQHLVHKTVLGLLSLIVFFSILAAQKKLGLHARQLNKMIQFGFVLLALAYFGSKFVLEVLLQ